MTVLRFAVLAIALALATVLFGWWSVPVGAALYGLLARHTGAPGALAALAGLTAWGGYLGLIASSGAPVGRLGSDFASALSLPGWTPWLATLAFPAILAGSAATLAAAIGRRVAPLRRSRR